MLCFYWLVISKRQKVKLKTCKGDHSVITTGFPQATILGPFFFILYDLLNDMPNDSILSYADDTVIISIEKSSWNAQDKMNFHLKKVWVAGAK